MSEAPRSIDQFPYVFPLTVDSDGLTILDATRTVVVPNISYRGDSVHLVKQKTVVAMIVKILNEFSESAERQLDSAHAGKKWVPLNGRRK